MRPAALLLRLAPLAVAGFFCLATSMPLPLEPITCDPEGEPYSPTAIELGPSETSEEPDQFFAWQDQDPVTITSEEGGGAILSYRLRIVGDGLPTCTRQLVTVSDLEGNELGRLDAALLTEADGPAAQLSYDAPIRLSRWPETGEELIVSAQVGETSLVVTLVAQ